MNSNRKMWVSAGVVGVILVGGLAVAATAAGRAAAVDQETGAVVEPNIETNSGRPPTRTQAPPTDDEIVTEDLNPNPRDVGRYWTEDRLEGAEPLPMPVATLLSTDETKN
ncbi:hypothetical protein [Spongiactinospora sp. TRM90649]|uniref:hypothetical protein n=1 Tax=Spongiactinospora sp. TRM90649 TaxID=3031114 RepID=UPI0023F642DE|nr:hypothetical protein [Spongiactinospora sp. TRM90649]MDF5757162.1 hypothetical protein [Spongiactinospora sp. TRM90649]